MREPREGTGWATGNPEFRRETKYGRADFRNPVPDSPTSLMARCRRQLTRRLRRVLHQSQRHHASCVCDGLATYLADRLFASFREFLLGSTVEAYTYEDKTVYALTRRFRSTVRTQARQMWNQSFRRASNHYNRMLMTRRLPEAVRFLVTCDQWQHGEHGRHQQRALLSDLRRFMRRYNDFVEEAANADWEDSEWPLAHRDPLFDRVGGADDDDGESTPDSTSEVSV